MSPFGGGGLARAPPPPELKARPPPEGSNPAGTHGRPWRSGVSAIANRKGRCEGHRVPLRWIARGTGPHVTPAQALVKQLEATHRGLIGHYCRMKGHVLSALVKAGVDTPDWLAAPEPGDVSGMPTALCDELVCGASRGAGRRVRGGGAGARRRGLSGRPPHLLRMYYACTTQ